MLCSKPLYSTTRQAIGTYGKGFTAILQAKQQRLHADLLNSLVLDSAVVSKPAFGGIVGQSDCVLFSKSPIFYGFGGNGANNDLRVAACKQMLE